MKIEYDNNLYKEIANFKINEIVRVTNREGIMSDIHITNIIKLRWNELQLLISIGTDGFSKRVLLYREYSSKKVISESTINGKALTSDESREISDYIEIYRTCDCEKHHEVNKIITQRNIWNQFRTIRSLNDHREYKEIEGIQPQYFEIICNILKISGGHGLPLDNYRKY